MASEELKLRYARLYIQRTYPNGNADKLAALKLLVDQINAAATDLITITSGSFEGGAGSGQVSFEKVYLALAAEEHLALIDPDYVPPPPQSSGSVLQFSPDVVGI